MDTFTIDGRPVGGGNPCFLIAEVAQAHDGSLGVAHSFIDLAADNGADAVKFQVHVADAESTRDEPFRVRFSYEDATRYDYWLRMEFTEEQWSGLAQHAGERGLAFLASTFSDEGAALLERVGVPAWKVASGEVMNHAMIRRHAETGLPVLLSSGMSTWHEINQAAAVVRDVGAPLAVMQCTSSYPTPLEQVGLNILDALAAEHDAPVGLSDHSGTVFPGLAAMARGAALLEVHVTPHKGLFGPDAVASVTFDELATLARARDAFALMDANPVDKDRASEERGETRRLFTRSLALRRPCGAGTVLTPELLTTKKPGDGIPPTDLTLVVGRRLRHDTPADRLLREDDLE